MAGPRLTTQRQKGLAGPVSLGTTMPTLLIAVVPSYAAPGGLL